MVRVELSAGAPTVETLLTIAGLHLINCFVPVGAVEVTNNLGGTHSGGFNEQPLDAWGCRGGFESKR